MSHEVNIRVASNFEKIVRDLDQVALTTLAHAQAPDGELTLVFTNNETIQRLNKEFAGKDQPTDVLSFPHGQTVIDSGQIYFGDVIIACPFAQSQAQEAGHSFQAELTLLVVHGVLHILGYDHSDESDRRKMWALQDEILQNIGAKILSPRQVS